MTAAWRQCRGVDFLAEPAFGSPLPSKGRGGIEIAFRRDWENFNAIGWQSRGVDFLVFRMSSRPRFPFARPGPILKGERSMSIGR